MYDYSNVSTDELKRRYDRLDADSSTTTMEAEIRRMAAVDAMATELIKRGVKLWHD